jgi:hypothetical protein
MPRKSTKKQTRLAFAPTTASASRDANDDNSDRFARLSYGHPSMTSVHPEVSHKSKPSGSKNKSSSKSKQKSLDLPKEAPVKDTSKGMPTHQALLPNFCGANVYLKPKPRHKMTKNHRMTTSFFPALNENDEQSPI